MANAKQKTTCCLCRFQFSENEYAKYPSSFRSESPVFIGILREMMKGEGYLRNPFFLIVLSLSTTKLIYNSLHTTISTPRYTITIRWR